MKENWDELIKQQERSGMKPTEFCRARGIDPSKFGYQRWRRKGGVRPLADRFLFPMRIPTLPITDSEMNRSRIPI